MPKTTHLAVTFAALLVGIALGRWLAAAREAPRRSYDREAAALARAAKARSIGLNWVVDNFRGGESGSTADEIR